jgi:hypothetical protein
MANQPAQEHTVWRARLSNLKHHLLERFRAQLTRLQRSRIESLGLKECNPLQYKLDPKSV